MKTEQLRIPLRCGQYLMKHVIIAALAILALGGVIARGACPPAYAQNFDGVTPPALPAGWVASQGMNLTGAPFWVTSAVTPATPPNDAFSTAPDNILDNRLDTPPIFVSSNNWTLTFQHSYDLDAGFDGAVLELSNSGINGGAFTDVTDPAVGGHFVSGTGYNTVISAVTQGPIAGRMAWGGNSNGYITVRLEFPPFNPGFFGNTVLRFRLVTDNSVSSTGWRIDTFSWDNHECGTPTPSPTATPTPTPAPTPTATPIPTPCGVTFSENFDGVAAPALPAGWSTSTTESAPPWGTSMTSPASGPNDAFASPAPRVSTSELVTPVIAAPAAGGILSFQNLFNLPVAADGMVLEISINGGPYTDIIAAGGSFVAGGYTHTIGGAFGNPIAGRMAWSGVSAGSAGAPAYLTSTLNLPATANGLNIQLRWLLATDSNMNLGPPSVVRIDSIFLTPASCAASPTPTPAPSPAQALNISTRLRVETGSSIAIGGFIVTGSGPKKVAIRGIGPSLGNSGLGDVLADPTLELRTHDDVLLTQNDNWQDDSTQAAQLIGLGLAPQHPNESGIVATLQPGAYTALLAGKNQTGGLALMEIYDADSAVASQLANISTRGFVRTGNNVMIGGFILGNSGASTNVVVRGIGPSLSQFGLSNVLADPTLELRNSNGAILVANDNWQDDPVSAAQLTTRGLAPTRFEESGIFAALPPGAFTAILAGKNGGTGLGLVEVYNVQ